MMTRFESIVVLCLSCAAASGTVHHVPQSQPTLEAALEVCTRGDTIIVGPGTHHVSLTIGLRDLTIQSIDPVDPDLMASTRLVGRDEAPVISIAEASGGVVLSGLTIAGGRVGIVNHAAGTVIDRCALANHQGTAVEDRGGAVITRTTIVNNGADGVYTEIPGPGRRNSWLETNIKSSVIASNAGSGIAGKMALVENCTIVQNGQFGLSLYRALGANNIVYYNGYDPNGVQVQAEQSDLNYCCIQGGLAGFGIKTSDPCFVSTGDGLGSSDGDTVWGEADYRLRPDSPCIEAGDPDTAFDPVDTDVAGNPRFNVMRVDMGAYCTYVEREWGRTELVYCTYFGGSGYDALEAPVDGGGHVCLAGYTTSRNMPTTTNAVARAYRGGIADNYVAIFSLPERRFVYGTYLGGYDDETLMNSTFDAQGNLYVTGDTMSDNFPTTPGAYARTFSGNSPQGRGDLYVVKFDPDGEMVFSTLLGGSQSEHGGDIAVDEHGAIYVTGGTKSSDFPGIASTSFRGGGDIFVSDAVVAKLSPDGGTLEFANYLAGRDGEWANSVCLADNGDAYVAGWTYSADFATTADAFGSESLGGYDIFLARIASQSGDILFSTLLGGAADEYPSDLFLDSRGHPVLACYSIGSSDFPTTPDACDGLLGAGESAALVVFDDPNQRLVYSSFLGRLNYVNVGFMDEDRLLISGRVDLPDLPTTPDAYDRSFNGGNDKYIAVFNLTDKRFEYATYFDTYGNEYGRVAYWGHHVVITGTTESRDLPVSADAYDRSHNGGGDTFIAVLALPPSLRQ